MSEQYILLCFRPLSSYNSLQDKHLAGYFNNTRMRRHLRRAGLISKSGDLVTETTYRLNMARKEHQKHVRDLLAQAIVHKALDIERYRQSDIKKKLEEIAKIELVRRVRLEKAHQGDEDIVPYLSPRSRRPKSAVEPTPSHPPGSRRPYTAPSKRPKSSKKKSSVYVDKDGFPVHRVKHDTDSDSQDLDSSCLKGLDSHALNSASLHMTEEPDTGGKSPYKLDYALSPQPPKSARGGRSASGRNGRRPIYSKDGKRIKAQSTRGGGSSLHRKEPAYSHATQPQTMCDVTVRYRGQSFKVSYEKEDNRDEVMICQQHCGGENLTVFQGWVEPGTDCVFTSRRHRGYPFGMTFYVNRVQVLTISACCEYKYKPGVILGGRRGHFRYVSVEGASPCYKCLVEAELAKRERDRYKGTQTELPPEEPESELVTDAKSTQADIEDEEKTEEGAVDAGTSYDNDDDFEKDEDEEKKEADDLKEDEKDDIIEQEQAAEDDYENEFFEEEEVKETSNEKENSDIKSEKETVQEDNKTDARKDEITNTSDAESRRKSSEDEQDSNNKQHTSDNDSTMEKSDRESMKQTSDRESVKEASDRESVKEMSDRESINETSDRESVKEASDRESIKETSDNESIEEAPDSEIKQQRDNEKEETLKRKIDESENDEPNVEEKNTKESSADEGEKDNEEAERRSTISDEDEKKDEDKRSTSSYIIEKENFSHEGASNNENLNQENMDDVQRDVSSDQESMAEKPVVVNSESTSNKNDEQLAEEEFDYAEESEPESIKSVSATSGSVHSVKVEGRKTSFGHYNSEDVVATDSEEERDKDDSKSDENSVKEHKNKMHSDTEDRENERSIESHIKEEGKEERDKESIVVNNEPESSHKVKDDHDQANHSDNENIKDVASNGDGGDTKEEDLTEQAGIGRQQQQVKTMSTTNSDKENVMHEQLNGVPNEESKQDNAGILNENNGEEHNDEKHQDEESPHESKEEKKESDKEDVKEPTSMGSASSLRSNTGRQSPPETAGPSAIRESETDVKKDGHSEQMSTETPHVTEPDTETKEPVIEESTIVESKQKISDRRPSSASSSGSSTSSISSSSSDSDAEKKEEKTLNFSKSDLSPRGARKVAKALKRPESKNIESLILRGNPIGDRGVKTIIRALADHQKDQIEDGKKSKLSEVDFTDCKIGTSGLEEISKFLKTNSGVANLNVSANPDIALDGWKQLADVLQTDASLKSLSVSDCQMGGESSASLLQGLVDNESLLELNIEGNKLSRDDGRHLLDLVKDNGVITSIQFERGNDIEQQTGLEIKEILETGSFVP
ncbi:uncharacterized protein [Antedon mediterranea]|uniref:uncharacterized protein n=1 Tax=Antedon mediterranea TaxID=105859 RepID=UPI003AF9027C